MTILDYVKEQHAPFSEVPFNPIDSLILTKLSYFHFENFSEHLNKKEKHLPKIKDLLKAELFPKLLRNVQHPLQSQALLINMGMSPRYRDIKFAYFEEKFDQNKIVQFAAITFIINETLAYIAYRGTDSSIIGWQEDFNMVFTFPIPSQIEAVEYLDKVAKKVKGRLILGGHSKGGNLAVYAASQSKSKVKDKIKAIYNHDGPGFLGDFYKGEEYLSIKAKIHKTVPTSALIGLLFYESEDYHIVKSNRQSVYQHNPFTWLITGNDFQYEANISRRAIRVNKTLHQWLRSANNEERELFVTTMFELIKTINVTDVSELNENVLETSLRAIRAYRKLDNETKKFIRLSFRDLIKLYFNVLDRTNLTRKPKRLKNS